MPQIVDARAADRFRGEVPGSRVQAARRTYSRLAQVLPFKVALSNADGTIDIGGQISAAVFEAAGVDLAKHGLITSCGSGVTAAILNLRAGADRAPQTIRSMTESWTEWGSYDDLRLQLARPRC